MKVSNKTMLRFAVICLFLGFALPVHAQALKGFDTDTPIEITADALEVLQKDEKAIFKGNVIAKQGKLQLNAAQMTVHYRNANKTANAQGVSKIEVVGDVFLSTPDESARSKQGLYDVDKNKITLLGDVVLSRGENVVKGEHLQYDLVTGRSQIVGGATATTGGAGGEKAPKGRVRGLFVPEKKDN